MSDTSRQGSGRLWLMCDLDARAEAVPCGICAGVEDEGGHNVERRIDGGCADHGDDARVFGPCWCLQSRLTELGALLGGDVLADR